MLTQLNPTIPVSVTTADGKHVNRTGEAFAVEQRSPEHHALWVVAFDDTGEIWWIPNPEVRVAFCWSSERPPRKSPAGPKAGESLSEYAKRTVKGNDRRLACDACECYPCVCAPIKRQCPKCQLFDCLCGAPPILSGNPKKPFTCKKCWRVPCRCVKVDSE